MKATAGRSERTEQAHIVQLARTLGASVYVLGTVRRKGDYPGTMQTPGVPDLWIMWDARLRHTLRTAALTLLQRGESGGLDQFVGTGGLWWEVKRKGGRLSDAQVAFGEQCEAAGVPYGWGDCDQFIAWCRAHGRLRGEIRRTALSEAR